MALASTGESGDYVELEARAMRARMGMHAHACLAPWEWRDALPGCDQNTSTVGKCGSAVMQSRR